MPTISGMRRRGYTPEAIRNFCDRIGVSKTNGTIELSLLEHSVREDLNKRAPRVMAVLRPLRVVIDNYPEGPGRGDGRGQQPRRPQRGHPQGAVLQSALHRAGRLPRGSAQAVFFRLAPGREVRLRYAYFITCTGVVKDRKTGEIVELHCTYDPATRGGNAPDGRKVKSTIHWVSAAHAIDAEVRLYDTLFTKEDPDDVEEGQDFTANLNPNSLEVSPTASWSRAWPARRPAAVTNSSGSAISASIRDSTPEKLVFNRTVALRDTWAKIEKKTKGQRMIILGIGGLLNDAACAVLKDGELLAAVEQKKVARAFEPGEFPRPPSPLVCASRACRPRTSTASPLCGPSPAARKPPCICRCATPFRAPKSSPSITTPPTPPPPTTRRRSTRPPS